MIRRGRAAVMITTAVAALYCAAIEIWLPRVDAMPVAPPAMIVALSSSVDSDGELSQVSRERLGVAIDLARSTGATLITTRVVYKRRPEVTSDRPQRRMVDSAGLSDRWRTLHGVAANTRDEAMRLRGVKTSVPIVVVTSRLHTRRACKTFERVGYTVTCVSSGLDGPWWIIPYSVAYESAAWIKYRYKRWILPGGRISQEL